MQKEQLDFLNDPLVDNAVTLLVFAKQNFNAPFDTEFVQAVLDKITERENEQPTWEQAFFAVTDSAQIIIQNEDIDNWIDQLEQFVESLDERSWIGNFAKGASLGFQTPKLFKRKKGTE